MSLSNKSTREISKIYDKRLILVFFVISSILLLLVSRLFYIQVLNSDELGSRALTQWFKTIETGGDRGIIYDRNYVPLTHRIKRDYILITPNSFVDEEVLASLSKVTSLSRNQLLKMISNKQEAIKLLIKYYDNKEIKKILSNRQIYILEESKRYDGSGLASHVVGYINKSNNTGEAGIEKSFDKELRENRIFKMGAIVDGKKSILPGLGYFTFENNEKIRKNIVTTINYKIQKLCEEEFDKNGYNGSIVVLDGKNGEVLAMVSRPNFDQNNIGKYLNSKNKELYNKGIQLSFPPGSIFKIIVTAAALENNVVDLNDRFVCKGYENLGVNIIKCHSFDDGGHGEITFEEAFLYSCNSVFIQIGKIIGGENIINMAYRFGLGQKSGIEILEEVEGILPSIDYVKGPGIGNISIGQGPLEVTPLQVARLTNIIVNNGIDVGVTIIKEIISDGGKTLKEFTGKEIRRVISEETADKIKRMMKGVIEKGTGKGARIYNIECAGKTGSAQAMGKNGETVHAWFAGYFLGRKSKYVISIIIEDGQSGGKTAAPLFGEIVEKMIKLGF